MVLAEKAYVPGWSDRMDLGAQAFKCQFVNARKQTAVAELFLGLGMSIVTAQDQALTF